MNKPERNSLVVAIIFLVVGVVSLLWLMVFVYQRVNEANFCKYTRLDQMSQADYQFCLSREFK